MANDDKSVALACIDPLEARLRVDSVDLATDVVEFLFVTGLNWGGHAYYSSTRPDLRAQVRARYEQRRRRLSIADRGAERRMANALYNEYGGGQKHTLYDLKTRLEERGPFRHFNAGCTAALNRVLGEYGIEPFGLRSHDRGAYLRKHGVRISRR